LKPVVRLPAVLALAVETAAEIDVAERIAIKNLCILYLRRGERCGVFDTERIG
jgi:hypothetical protein